MTWMKSVGKPVSPSQAMELALSEAKRGWGFVSPNPLVGCTIVDADHRLLSVGYHARVGGAHAEIAAIKLIDDPEKIKGAHVYVTLEPCAHQGRTGSCAKALVPLKPASVTYAVLDPNPLVAGKGAQILTAAGIRCEALRTRLDIADRMELAERAEEIAEIFLWNQRTGKPFVALKVAMSSDGMIASKTGEPRWLTGPESREHVHWLRAGYDAILVGRGTFDADDPSLNVRHPAFPDFENRAILLDPSGRSFSALLSLKLIGAHDPENIFVIVGSEASLQGGIELEIEAAEGLTSMGLNLLELPLRKDGEFEIDLLLQTLFEAGIRSILVEGGARTYGTFVRANKVNRVHAYKAPMTIGDENGLSWSGGFPEAELIDRLDISRIERSTFGVDEYWTAPVKV